MSRQSSTPLYEALTGKHASSVPTYTIYVGPRTICPASLPASDMIWEGTFASCYLLCHKPLQT